MITWIVVAGAFAVASPQASPPPEQPAAVAVVVSRSQPMAQSPQSRFVGTNVPDIQLTPKPTGLIFDQAAVRVLNPNPPVTLAPPACPRYMICEGTILTTYGVLHLQAQSFTLAKDTPELSAPGGGVLTIQKAGTVIQTAGYIDTSTGRWYEETQTGTGWVQL